MPRKRPVELPRVDNLRATQASLEVSAAARTAPLVFISHDSRDADLAEAFDHLLTDASGGVVQTFRSSDQTGRAGIDYGENWFSKITKTLSDATDVVALLTPNSIGRPWILFEAGFAVGRLDAKVFGIALGLPLTKAVAGPFAQFQNCEANEESLTTVVLQLIQRNPSARPREQAVRKQVGTFLEEIVPLLTQRTGVQEETKEEMDATAVAKVFEEVKVMFRDLPGRVQSELRANVPSRGRGRFHPDIVEEIFFMSRVEDIDSSLPWLLLGSVLREEAPWLADPVLEVYRAMRNGDSESVERTYHDMQVALRIMTSSRAFRRLARSDGELSMFFRHLPEILDRLALPVRPEEGKRHRGKAELQSLSNGEPEPEKR